MLDFLDRTLLLLLFGHTACGILPPQPGIEPGPSAVKAQNPNHWSTREFPRILIFLSFHFYYPFFPLLSGIFPQI